jgi:tetratricopeptide (TPR) repeat protein
MAWKLSQRISSGNYVFLLLASLQGIYMLTVCPTVYLGDSGELTAAAFCLGIPHNTGYPLYCLLGKLFCLAPLGNVAFRVNLMSACLAVATVWLVYSMILKWTGSRLAGFVGAGVLAFSRVFWLQTVSAEVYTLHAFFVALLIRVLAWWDGKKDFCALALLVFLTGLSFGNHMQTVMLAPSVLWMVFSGDRKALLNVKRFGILTALFVVALAVYVYLPIRTEAGAAIHWGDPNTLDRFIAHVTGSTHRELYVLNKSPWEMVARAKDASLLVWSQLGVMIFFSVWGWVRAKWRWRVFWLLVIVFDFVYTVFLNTVSLKITAFNLPTTIGLSILLGAGIAEIMKRLERAASIGKGTRRVMKVAWSIIPAIGLMSSFSICNQSRNYTGFEHGWNVLMTGGIGDTIVLSGDNYIFPVTYHRIVERTRENVRLYDRADLLFKLPFMDPDLGRGEKHWERYRNDAEKRIVKEKGRSQVFYAVFGPYSIVMGDPYELVPFGVLYRVSETRPIEKELGEGKPWKYYASMSFSEDFYRDFMTREVCAYFYFRKGEYLIRSGDAEMGLREIQAASEIAYDDNVIHSDMGVFFTDQGFFVHARHELEKALIYHDDLSGVYNNWGYLYNKMGEHEKSVQYLQKAVELSPTNAGYHNNLGFALYEVGREKECLLALEKSLSLNPDQPAIKKFIKEKLGE